MFDKAVFFSKKIIIVITTSLLSIILICVFYSIKESTPFFIVKLAKLFFAFSTLLILFKFINLRIISSRLFIVSLLTISFLVRLWWIYKVDTEPISDFKVMFEAATDLANGKTEGIYNNHYFFIYADNIGFTVYQSLILLFFKTLFALKVVNAITGTLIVYLLYKISQNIFSEDSARVSAVIVALYSPFIVYTSVLTNQTLSIFLLLVGLLLFFRKKNLIVVGLFLGLSYLIRPTAIIYTIGVALIIIYQEFSQHKLNFKNILKYSILKNLKVGIPFLLLIFIASILFQITNISKHSLFDNPIPNYKLLVGLNHETTGGYSQDDARLLGNPENFRKNVDSMINKRIEDKSKLLILFGDKFNAMWGQHDSSRFWSMTKDVKDKHEFNFIKLYEQYFYLIILLFGIIFLVSTLKRGVTLISSKHIFICITLLGFVLAYFFIEIQTRYRYEIYPLFILLAGAGVAIAYKRIFPNTKEIAQNTTT